MELCTLAGVARIIWTVVEPDVPLLAVVPLGLEIAFMPTAPIARVNNMVITRAPITTFFCFIFAVFFIFDISCFFRAQRVAARKNVLKIHCYTLTH
jgi:hypothetical protein